MIGQLIGALLVGLFAGGAARIFVPPPHPLGCLGTAILGVAGSVVGGMISHLVLGSDKYQPGNFFVSVIGAATLLWLARQKVKQQ